jgi:hypothetical protein
VNGDELVSLVAVGLLRPLLALTAFGRGYSYIRCSFSFSLMKQEFTRELAPDAAAERFRKFR